MPGRYFTIYKVTPAFVEAIWTLSWFMENRSTYFVGARAGKLANAQMWAEISAWYLQKLGLKGNPHRTINEREYKGFNEIINLLIKAGQHIVGLGRAGVLNDQALEAQMKTWMDGQIRGNANMLAAVRFLQDDMAPTGFRNNIQMPGLDQLRSFVGQPDNRHPLERAQTLAIVKDIAEHWAEDFRQRNSDTPGAAPGAAGVDPLNIYDQVRVESTTDTLRLDPTFDSPFQRLPDGDHVYGPAPLLNDGAP